LHLVDTPDQVRHLGQGGEEVWCVARGDGHARSADNLTPTSQDGGLSVSRGVDVRVGA
jgi:hypothetical protein